MSRFLSLILLALLAAACAPLTPAPTQIPLATPEVALQGNWMIGLTQSGGIMGMMREMEISSDGQFKITDDRTGKTVSGQLTADQLTQLKNLVSGSAYRRSSVSTSCADCFNYTVEIDSSTGQRIVAQADDVSLQASGMSSLIEFLRTLMQDALKNQG